MYVCINVNREWKRKFTPNGKKNSFSKRLFADPHLNEPAVLGYPWKVQEGVLCWGGSHGHRMLGISVPHSEKTD